MKDQALVKRIGTLSDANGVSGFEEEVVDRVLEGVQDLSVSVDSFNNTILRRKGDKKPYTVLIEGHSDEVGFMVSSIQDNGTLSFLPVGGWDSESIVSAILRVRNRDGVYIKGVVGSVPPHYRKNKEGGKTPVSELFIDVGASSRKECMEDFKISIGAPVVPDTTFTYDQAHDLLCGKAFDNRLGVAAVLEVLEALKEKDLQVNVVGAICCQEEVGSRGASAIAHRVKADLAIIFEGAPADDTIPGLAYPQTALGQGPMLRHIDARMITHPRFQRYALDLAHQAGIPCQEAVRAGGGTDGAPIHISNETVPSIVVGVPVRYAHTCLGLSKLSDFKNACRLACQLIEGLDDTRVREICFGKRSH